MSASIKPSFDPAVMLFLSSFPTIPSLTVDSVEQFNSSLLPVAKPEVAITDPGIAYEELAALGQEVISSFRFSGEETPHKVPALRSITCMAAEWL
jgi:hypothetical protein